MLFDLEGKVFGRLTVISKDENRKGFIICKCSCGSELVSKRRGDVVKGDTSSCGCYRAEFVTKHGHSKRGFVTKTYKVWNDMLRRCLNSNHPSYKDYGARGITVCPTWQDNYNQFLLDMGECPKGLSLDRINNELGYGKDNCRWATWKEQARNKRSNHFLTYNGETKTIAEWSEQLGLHYRVIFFRLKNGWTIEQALTTEVASRTFHTQFTFRGKTQTLPEWARELGVDRRLLHSRFKSGWSVEETLGTPFRKNNYNKAV